MPHSARRDSPPLLPEIPPMPGGIGITRASLKDGSTMAAIRATAPPDVLFRTELELAESLDDTLQHWASTDDLYVFGYGSLMWNPAFEFEASARATVHGWSRKFCLWLYLARGSQARPGLMLALDQGGACRGMVFRIAAAKVREELPLLWRREMLSDAYQARWVTAGLADHSGRTVRALTFVINRRNERYARHLTDDQVAHYIKTGAGDLGTCAAYFDATVATLQSLGITDAGIERIRGAVARGTAVPMATDVGATPAATEPSTPSGFAVPRPIGT